MIVYAIYAIINQISLNGTTTNRHYSVLLPPITQEKMNWEPKSKEMEKVIVKLSDPVYLSAAAAVLSAFFAGIAILFSLRSSTRERLDIVKADILRFVSIKQNRDKWVITGRLSQIFDGSGIGPDARRLARYLGFKYKRKKWCILLPAAIEELRHEGYEKLLGI